MTQIEENYKMFLSQWSSSFYPKIMQNILLSFTGGGIAGPAELDEIDELVADILGKANVTIVGVNKAQDILAFVHEAVEQPPR